MAGSGQESDQRMSYILDALKKLDHEKSRKIRGDGVVNISGALFERDRPRPAGTAGWKIALAVSIAVLVTFAGTWYYLRFGTGWKNNAARPATRAAQVVPAPLPAVPLAVSGQNTPPTAPTVAPPAAVSPVQTLKPPAPPVQLSAPPDTVAAPGTQQEPPPRRKARKSPPSAAAPTMAAPADIKLSGIAYQDERRARRAVVNGFLMQEGGVVAGAVITDIFQDRVRFSLAGSSFELSLISSGVPASGK